MTDDDRFIVIETAADTVVFGDTNNIKDVFIRDYNDSSTERISVKLIGGFSGFFRLTGRHIVRYGTFARNCRSPQPGALTISPAGPHPSPLGHAINADTLAEHFVQNGLARRLLERRHVAAGHG